jgi:hypothetical protein
MNILLLFLSLNIKGLLLKELQQHHNTPYIPFLTLTEGHSGSTWFRLMLNSHPCINSHGEILRAKEKSKHLLNVLALPPATAEESHNTTTAGSDVNSGNTPMNRQQHKVPDYMLVNVRFFQLHCFF